MRLEETPVEGTEPRNKRLPENPEDFKATLAEHIDELRQRIVRSLLLLSVAWLIGWFLQPWLYDNLNILIEKNVRAVLGPRADYKDVFHNATEMFMLKLRLSFLIGLILSLPFIVLQVWGFVKPGLKPKERQPIERMAPLSVFLFLLGAVFCWIILGPAIQFFASFLKDFPGASLYQQPGTMIFFVLKMMLAFGVGFQLPLIVYALGSLNLLSAKTLMKYWRQSSVIIFVASAILTPSADAFSMLMMAIPLVILFMISVYAVKVTQRRREKLLDVDREPLE